VLYGILYYPFSYLVDNRKCWNQKVSTDYIVSSRWRLTWYLFLQNLLTIALISFLIEKWTQSMSGRPTSLSDSFRCVVCVSTSAVTEDRRTDDRQTENSLL